MATPNVGILTTAGKTLIDKINAGQAKITFSKIVFSSMDNSQLSDDQIKALTAITPQEVVVNSPEATLDANTGETRIRATGTNENLTDGVYVKTYGVFAKDDTGNEILYGVTVSPNPNYFPAYDGVTPQAVTYSYKVNISNTSNITFTNSNDIYVSDTDLAEALQPYAKTVDVNQQLDKKVNVADMRKPASDVAGIEEVNAKQDKIGYTPADDSKVLHSTVTQLSSTDMNTVLTAGFYRLISGTNGMPNADAWTIYQVITWSGSNGVQLAYGTNNAILGMRSWSTINSKISFSNWVKLSDDSKVIHNTGSEEIAGTKTFDTAPIDKTTGNPYITKDGVPAVPSTLADTTKPANFTAGLQSGGVDVATAADIKSLEASAWRPIISNNYSGLCMMKYNADTETMSLSGTIFPKTYSTEGSRVAVIIPMPEGFSMGENTDSKTTIWTNATGSVQKFAGIVADLKYESDGIHIIFDKIYSNYPDPKMFIILDDFFAYSTANPQSNNLINFKVTKN